MTAVKKVAIAGSGVAALATAIQLAKAGVEVDVFEAKPEPSALGSGISLQGNALRVFDALGAWDDIRAAGYPFEGLNLRAPGPGAPIVAELPDVKTGGPDYPAADGDAARRRSPGSSSSTRQRPVRTSASARRSPGSMQGDDHVEVFVNDESAGVYDLLVGADGLNSTVRDIIGIETKPEPTGMGIWRSFVSRPAEVVRTELYYGGPVYIAGYTPTGEDRCTRSWSRRRRTASAPPTTRRRRSCSTSRARTTVRGTRSAPTSRRGAHANYTWFTQHIVAGAVEPRARRRDRGCRAQLPPDDRAGRGPGARGRARPDRAARRARRRRPGPVGRVPRAPPAARAARWSRHPSSSASGSSTAIRDADVARPHVRRRAADGGARMSDVTDAGHRRPRAHPAAGAARRGRAPRARAASPRRPRSSVAQRRREPRGVRRRWSARASRSSPT